MVSKKKNETLVDTICDFIRMDIIKQELVPGQKLQPKELAEKYGVSETPVKFAMERLVAEKIVENFPRQGMRVKYIDLEEAKEIFEIRRMMDLYYVKQIIVSVNTNDRLKNALIRNVDEHRKAITEYNKNQDPDLYQLHYKHDYQFHELYLKCSGNGTLVEMYQKINPFVYSHYIYRRQTFEKNLAGVEEHANLINAIFAKDEEKVKQSVNNHIDNAINTISMIVKVDKIL
ncbi:GntR family transcriptional regulator [Faecalicatena contorta]|uniref:DNA-binding transcriptional regulator, GntR family n=1 Tax=Faecalicatena contorta TaxID=39482 RepID=A0A315ZY47_9FIRM|nr:GntR family transcriptional regulator [Faecalicatena contorta]PWJ49820.1 DNA-binding GntR family transcriptional regulator [Faecalicatena contorta]SUQ14538.1 DNA-binding transcriptional regulator, GntR family [Faecalicatena contorta]